MDKEEKREKERERMSELKKIDIYVQVSYSDVKGDFVMGIRLRIELYFTNSKLTSTQSFDMQEAGTKLTSLLVTSSLIKKEKNGHIN